VRFDSARRLAALLLTALLTVTVSAAIQPAPAVATGAAMPPFSPAFAERARDYYRIVFTADGYPARRNADGTLFEHPIYPIYVLNDYRTQYLAHPSPRLANAISTVAKAAIKRMRPLDGGLVFWYQPDPTTASRLYVKHFSALTQSYYATQLWKAGDLIGDNTLKVAGSKAFAALLIPASRGGVLYKDRNGISIAEVPQQPNSYILNGWLTALTSVWGYYRSSGDLRALSLVRDSARTMTKVLPRYDSTSLSISRYALTGFAYVRVVGTTYSTLSLTVPGAGKYLPVRVKHPSRWQMSRVNTRQANIVVSYSSYPSANVLTMKPRKAARVQLLVGRYNPLLSGSTDGRWVTIGTVTPSRPSIKIPWSSVDRLVQPTNFAKLIRGHRTNVYHSIHIDRLKQLYAITGYPALRSWAVHFEREMCRWKRLPVYRGLWASVPGANTYRPVSRLCT